MRIKPEQLAQDLERHLRPVYLLSGDEPLQLGEAADAIRAAARAAGHDSREVLDAGSGFDWQQLTAAADALSLFADKRIIDLRLPSGKPGSEGSAALCAYCADPPIDTVLLLTLPRLERAQLNGKWVKAIDQIGAVLQVWPLAGGQLVRWIEQRLRAAGFRAEAGVAEHLAERAEGNLLAARQEIEKLGLLHEPGPLGLAALQAATADSARFDVFKLTDAALAGDTLRTVRILTGLRAEGTAAPVVLWSLHRELRDLAGLAHLVSNGLSASQAMARQKVMERRRPGLAKALSRLSAARCQVLLTACSRVDRRIKGADIGDPWLALERLSLELAGGVTAAAGSTP